MKLLIMQFSSAYVTFFLIGSNTHLSPCSQTPQSIVLTLINVCGGTGLRRQLRYYEFQSSVSAICAFRLVVSESLALVLRRLRRMSVTSLKNRCVQAKA
jgi:hypothetical protein